MKFFAFLHNPKRTYAKRYHSQSAPHYHQTPRETISDVLKRATSFAGNESSLKLNNLQSTFKPIWQRHNCPLILDSNPSISEHFRKYLATLMIQATYSSEAKWTLNEWTGINVLRESNTCFSTLGLPRPFSNSASKCLDTQSQFQNAKGEKNNKAARKP